MYSELVFLVRLVSKNWHSARRVAKNLWVGCAQAGTMLCVTFAELVGDFGKSVLPPWLHVEIVSFMHGLYKVFTQAFHNQLLSFTAVIFRFYTLYTGLITKTTT